MSSDTLLPFSKSATEMSSISVNRQNSTLAAARGSDGAIKSIPIARPNSAIANSSTASSNAKNKTLDSSKQCNVQVVVRCRPQNEKERKDNEYSVTGFSDDGTEVNISTGNKATGVQLKATTTKRTFTFDHVFNSSVDQAEVYNTAVKPLVEEALAGFNCTVFAYGQTGTGKTHTMEGDITNAVDAASRTRHAGVIPRSVHTIFDELAAQSLDAVVKCSFMELYNEDLSDLLAERQQQQQQQSSSAMSINDDTQQLRLMENNEKGVVVQGLEEIVVRSAAEVFVLLSKAHARRRVAETLMNKSSSRSHCVFTITMSVTESSDEGEDVVKIGKLHLVDLAGSECVGRSGAQGGRAVEAGNINKSLLTLGRVINALVEKSGHVPYRESKLTRLLQESLGGRAKTVIIATISPSSASIDETLSTLDYAYRAKNIKNKPQVNEKKSGKTYMRELQLEISTLKRELDAQRSKNGIILPIDIYDTLIASSRSSGAMVYELETRLKAKEEEWLLMEALVNESAGKLAVSTTACDLLTVQLSESEAVVASTQQQLATTESKLLVTQDTVVHTRTDLKQTQYHHDEQQYLVHQQQITEQQLLLQAKQLKRTTETIIADKNLLHVKVQRQADVEAANNATTLKFEDTVQQQLLSGTALLEADIDNQNSSIQQLLLTVEQQRQQLTAHAQQLVSDVRDSMGKVQSQHQTLDASAKQFHERSAAQYKDAAAVSSAACQVSTAAVLATQVASQEHSKNINVQVAAIANSHQKAQLHTATSNNTAIASDRTYSQQLSSEITAIAAKQQQHSGQQILVVSNAQAAIEAFMQQHQQRAAEQSAVLYLSVQSLIETFKQQQLAAVTAAVNQLATQLAHTVAAEQRHAAAVTYETAVSQKGNDQWLSSKQQQHAAATAQLATDNSLAGVQHEDIAISNSKWQLELNTQLTGVNAVRVQQQVAEQKQVTEHQQLLATFSTLHHQQIEGVQELHSSSSNKYISDSQRHTDTVLPSHTASLTTALQQQLSHLSTHQQSQSAVTSSLRQHLHQYIHTDIAHDHQTHSTPKQRNFILPHNFSSTVMHDTLQSQFHEAQASQIIVDAAAAVTAAAATATHVAEQPFQAYQRLVPFDDLVQAMRGSASAQQQTLLTAYSEATDSMLIADTAATHSNSNINSKSNGNNNTNINGNSNSYSCHSSNGSSLNSTASHSHLHLLQQRFSNGNSLVSSEASSPTSSRSDNKENRHAMLVSQPLDAAATASAAAKSAATSRAATRSNSHSRNHSTSSFTFSTKEEVATTLPLMQQQQQQPQLQRPPSASTVGTLVSKMKVPSQLPTPRAIT